MVFQCRHTNICGEEISACCLDDRKRKIVIGDVTGRIGVYNYANGALMKTVHYEADKRSIVVSVEYFDEAKRFIAGYANGLMCLYDENVLEECHLIRSFEHFNQHPELLSLRFNPFNRMAATAGGSSGLARLWDYDSGKCENELNVCHDGEGHIVHLSLLLPYPIIVTADSSGTIVLWGSRGIKWQGFRIAGFSNATPASADLEPRIWKSDDEGDGPPRRAVPPPAPVVGHDDVQYGVNGGDGFARQQSRLRVAEDEEDDSNQLKLMLMGRKSAMSFSLPVDESSMDSREVEKRLLAEQLVDRLIRDSEAKWGKLSAAHTMCWDPGSLRLFTADDLGCLRCYSLRNIFLDLQIASPDPNHPEMFVYNSGSGVKLMGICKRKQRDERSAVPCRPIKSIEPPTPADLFVLGKRNDASAYQGVDFCWALDAHNDRIITCASTPYGVLTSAADRLVKMWTFDGLPVGTLLQSVPVSTRSRTWDLVLDVKSIIERENQELDAMIDQVTELSLRVDRPNIDHMDFTGMQLGADSADFSRSQLRQRIEKTGKILGLDFPSHKQIHPRHGSPRGLLDDSSVLEASTVTSVNKSLEDALREIKSTDSAVDYDTKTKQMSYIQQRRKATKLETISKAFEARLEAKTGVRVHVGGASVTGASHATHGKHKSIAESAEEHSGDADADENGGDLDQMLISLADVKPRDDASVNNDMYSHGSNDHLQLRHHYVSKRRETKSKIAESIKSAHDRGPRTISMSRSCAKYAASDELNSAMARRPNQQISSEQVLEMRKRREEKHKLFFVSVTSDNVAKLRANQAKDGMLLSRSEPANNASSNSLLVSQSMDSLDAATTLHTQHSQTSYESGGSDIVR
jgi:hypothetical protein